MTTDASPNQPPTGNKPGLAARLRGRLLGPLAKARSQALLALIVILAIVALVTPLYLFSLRSLRPVPVTTASEKEILATLDAGDIDTAERMAKRIAGQRLAMSADRSAAYFALGTILCERGDRRLGEAQIKLFAQAADYLAQAEEIGFPAGHESQGAFLLGKSRLASGQGALARAPLRAALERGEGRFPGLHRMLADAFLREPGPEPATSLKYINAYLAQTRMSPAERRTAELLRAEILFRLDQVDECRAALAKLLVEDDYRLQAQILDARLLMAAGRKGRDLAKVTGNDQPLVEAQQGYQKAIEGLKKVQAAAPRDHALVATCLYLTGLCQLELADRAAAQKSFEQTYRRYIETPEGWAALLEIADLQMTSGQIAAGVQSYLEAIRVSSRMTMDNNPWISIEAFRERLLKAYAQLVDLSLFGEAIELAQWLAPPFTEHESAQYQAQAYRAWGRKLLADAERTAPDEAVKVARLGRAKLRQAGALFNGLAEARFATRYYPEDRWSSAECYQEAQNYPLAIWYMREYLSLTNRRDRPRTLVALGRALLAEGKYDSAIEVLLECIEYHSRHPAIFQARLVCSDAYLEKGDFARAEQMLVDNLDGDRLAPASLEWREALFGLGRILHQQAKYASAVTRLAEAVDRYPEDHQALAARYLIADSQLQQAVAVSARLEGEKVEQTRGILINQRRQLYDRAVAMYQQVIERLSELETNRPLNRLEQGIQRTSLFNHAAVLVALGRHADGVEAYTFILNRYQNAPESLAAYVQLARCYRETNDRLEATNALALANVVLGRMQPDAPFDRQTGFSRDMWAGYLDWLKTL